MGQEGKEVLTMAGKKAGLGAPTFIGRGVKLEAARMSSQDRARIDGEYCGDLDLLALVIGESGCVTGDIHAKSIEIAGRVTGNILGGIVVHIKSTAHVEGHIETQTLIAEKGSWFNGQCQMVSAQMGEIPLLETDIPVEYDNFDNRMERFISTITG